MPYDTLLRRIRAEYLEMPGLAMTRQQAQRLCGADPALLQRVLDELVEAKFLHVKPNGSYARASEGGEVPRPRPAKAGIGRAKHAVASSRHA